MIVARWGLEPAAAGPGVRSPVEGHAKSSRARAASIGKFGARVIRAALRANSFGATPALPALSTSTRQRA
eukprot:1391211-Alexandrium_andersonii.AAC.1